MDNICRLGDWHMLRRTERLIFPKRAKHGLHWRCLCLWDLLHLLFPHGLLSAQVVQISALIRRLQIIFARNGDWFEAYAAKRL